jgi:hypothetical protein
VILSRRELEVFARIERDFLAGARDGVRRIRELGIDVFLTGMCQAVVIALVLAAAQRSLGLMLGGLGLAVNLAVVFALTRTARRAWAGPALALVPAGVRSTSMRGPAS